MKLAESADIFLQPGELHFGGGRTRVRTLLGSCVAISLWHPRLRIGGLCHYLLPRASCPGRSGAKPTGRYAEDAIDYFLRELHHHSTRPSEYEAKLFGGGHMFPGRSGSEGLTIPDRNIEIGRALLARHGFRIAAEHIGGAGRRQVVFEIWSGDVWVRYEENDDSGEGPISA